MESQLHQQISEILVFARKLEHDVETNTREEYRRQPTYEEQLNTMLKPGEKSPKFIGQLETLYHAHEDGQKSVQRLQHYSLKLQNLMDPVVRRQAEQELGGRIAGAQNLRSSRSEGQKLSIMDIIDRNITSLGGNIYE